MDASRIVGLAILSLLYIVLSNQAPTDENNFKCPLDDHPRYENDTLVHNLTRTVKCVNGRKMSGCCVKRQYCNFNTSHIDLTSYGPPGYRMTCKHVCCPQKFILPIPLPANTMEATAAPTKSSTEDDDDDASMDPDDNVVDDD